MAGATVPEPCPSRSPSLPRFQLLQFPGLWGAQDPREASWGGVPGSPHLPWLEPALTHLSLSGMSLCTSAQGGEFTLIFVFEAEGREKKATVFTWV